MAINGNATIAATVRGELSSQGLMPSGMVVLPVPLRKASHVEEGSLLIGDVTDAGILLRPVVVVPVLPTSAQSGKAASSQV